MEPICITRRGRLLGFRPVNRPSIADRIQLQVRESNPPHCLSAPLSWLTAMPEGIRLRTRSHDRIPATRLVDVLRGRSCADLHPASFHQYSSSRMATPLARSASSIKAWSLWPVNGRISPGPAFGHHPCLKFLVGFTESRFQHAVPNPLVKIEIHRFPSVKYWLRNRQTAAWQCHGRIDRRPA